MINLENRVEEIKLNLISKNLKYIKKCKYKTIPTNEHYKYNEEKLKSYNYYVRLTKKVKKYIKDFTDIVFYTNYDKFNNLVCIISKFDINKIDINLNIDIRIIIGDKQDTYIKATYYEEKCGILYLEEFMSGSRKNGYGSMLLDNLNFIIDNINNVLKNYNKYSKDYNFKPIKILKGKAIPYKSVITQDELNKLYIKHGFQIDNNNYLFKNRE